MITVVSGTNRRNSETLYFARHYAAVAKSLTAEPVRLLSMEDVPAAALHVDMYTEDGQNDHLAELQDDYILGADRFIFLLPEYNGGMPGVLKLFLDAISVRAYGQNFKGKKAALVGIASGRAGNLRGIDHLNGVLQHMGTLVLPNKLPISSISGMRDDAGNIVHRETQEAIEKQVRQLLAL